MRAFTTGEPRSLLTVSGVEAVKWIALTLMLIEHVYRYVLDQFPFWVYVLGRSVFPLFALALGVALAGTWDRSQPRRTVARLLLWSLIASAARSVLLPTLPINVLLTFALGITAYAVIRSRTILGCGIGALLVAAGVVAEFGAWGVVAVVLCMAYGEQRRIVFAVGAIAAIGASQMTLVPMIALPLAWCIDRCVGDVPRIRGAFYWGYVAQWPLVAVLRALV